MSDKVYVGDDNVKSYDRTTVFASAQVFDLEEGGQAHVSLYAYRDTGSVRTHVTVDPRGSLLTSRDVGILAGLLLGSAFAPPLRPVHVAAIPPSPDSVGAGDAGT